MCGFQSKTDVLKFHNRENILGASGRAIRTWIWLTSSLVVGRAVVQRRDPAALWIFWKMWAKFFGSKLGRCRFLTLWILWTVHGPCLRKQGWNKPHHILAKTFELVGVGCRKQLLSLIHAFRMSQALKSNPLPYSRSDSPPNRGSPRSSIYEAVSPRWTKQQQGKATCTSLSPARARSCRENPPATAKLESRKHTVTKSTPHGAWWFSTSPPPSAVRPPANAIKNNTLDTVPAPDRLGNLCPPSLSSPSQSCAVHVTETVARLRKAKVVTASSNRLENLAAENVVALILGEIEFCGAESGQQMDIQGFVRSHLNLRLKQV